MKKFLLLLYLLPVSLFAQFNYFPSDSAKWCFVITESGSSNLQEIKIGSNIVYKGNTYKRLIQRTVNAVNYDTVGMIRNGDGKKVYGRVVAKSCHADLSDTCEYLLYDFNLKKGDFFNAHLYYASRYFRFKVCNVDSIMLNTAKHLRIQLIPWDTLTDNTTRVCWGNIMDTAFYWIEGVGSSFGPLYSKIQPYVDVADSTYITCYQYKDILEIGDVECSSLLSVKNYDASKINVFPNPAADYITIETASNTSRYIAEIYSSQGVLVKRSMFFENSHQLSISDLQNGVYFVKLIDDKGNEMLVKRVICLK